MYRNSTLVATCLAFAGSSAFGCIQLADSAIDAAFEAQNRVDILEATKLQRVVDRKELFKEFQYNPPNPVAAKNDVAVQVLLRGDAKLAVEMLQAIESRHPGAYFTAANLGTAYELAGDDENALKWIREGLKRNSAARMKTEWLHARILETKLKLKQDPSWLDSHTITEADFSQLGDPKYTLPASELPVNGEEMRRNLWSQLSVRMLFVKPKDAIVAHLLRELALAEAKAGFQEQALGYLKLAEQYGLPSGQMTTHKLKWKFAAGWADAQRQVWQLILLILPLVPVYLFWRWWKSMREMLSD